MSTVVTARNVLVGSGAVLYQLVSKHCLVFEQKSAEEGRVLPDYVKREFEDYLLRLLLVNASARISIGHEAEPGELNLIVCYLQRRR